MKEIPHVVLAVHQTNAVFQHRPTISIIILALLVTNPHFSKVKLRFLVAIFGEINHRFLTVVFRI